MPDGPPSDPSLASASRDADLLARCAKGDQHAWATLIREHSGLVYAIARYHHMREDQCDDVAQSVFAALLRHVGSIRDARALPAWLSQTTRRACWRLARHDRRQHAVEGATGGPASSASVAGEPSADLLAWIAPASQEHADQAADRLEQLHRLRRALDELGGRCRELLRALFIESQHPDYHVIAARLGMPVGSIGPTRGRCLEKLAEILGTSTPDQEP